MNWIDAARISRDGVVRPFSQSPKQLRTHEHRFARAITPGDQWIRLTEDFLPSQSNRTWARAWPIPEGRHKAETLEPKACAKGFLRPRGLRSDPRGPPRWAKQRRRPQPAPKASLDVHGNRAPREFRHNSEGMREPPSINRKLPIG